MVNGSPIYFYKTKSLSNLRPSSLIAVKVDGEDFFSLYVTDKTGIPYPIKDETGGGGGGTITAIQNTDGNLEITGTTTKTINVSPSLLSLINSALQPGDNVSELSNDAGYITLADIPTFNPTDYDLEDFTNTSADPFARMSDISSSSFVTATHTVYVSKDGNDTNTGLTLDNLKLTIGSAITQATTLLGAGATGVRIEVLDGGTYVENVALPNFVALEAPAATFVGSIDMMVSTVNLNRHYASTPSYCLKMQNDATSSHGFYKVNILDGRGVDGTLVSKNCILKDVGKTVLFVEAHIIYVPENGIGVTSLDDGFAHIHLYISDLYLAGNNAIGINLTTFDANIIGYIDHILEIAAVTNTKAIVISNADAKGRFTIGEIVADIAYEVTAGSLYLNCSRIVGTQTGTPLFLTENSLNKKTDLTSTDPTHYPNVPAVVAGLGTKENTVTPGTTAQYYRGDKTFQTLDKTAVGLGNVDNTSDVNKPISTATQAVIDLIPVVDDNVFLTHYPVGGIITLNNYIGSVSNTTFSSNVANSNGLTKFQQFVTNKAITIDELYLSIQNNNTGASATATLYVYDDSNDGLPGVKLHQEISATNIFNTPNTIITFSNNFTLQPGVYWIGIHIRDLNLASSNPAFYFAALGGNVKGYQTAAITFTNNYQGVLGAAATVSDLTDNPTISVSSSTALSVPMLKIKLG